VARQLAVLGAPSGAGACGVGQERAPEALRAAGLIESLASAGFDVSDLGDAQVVPWRPRPSQTAGAEP
jgi:arginase